MASPPQEPPRATLDDIGAGRETAQQAALPGAKDDLEAANLDEEKKRAEISQLKSTTSMRENYESKVYRYLVGYSLCALGLLIASGLGQLRLADNVLLAVAGSTAVSAIGLVAQIGKGLFGGGPQT